jgi:hypothetical protein
MHQRAEAHTSNFSRGFCVASAASLDLLDSPLDSAQVASCVFGELFDSHVRMLASEASDISVKNELRQKVITLINRQFTGRNRSPINRRFLFWCHCIAHPWLAALLAIDMIVAHCEPFSVW